jgi:hypothetical protein
MSMPTGGSSGGSSSLVTEIVFNMSEEHDVLALLRHIHVSTLPLEIKNYLRDLVFSTRFGTPVPVDTAMIATFRAHGFVIKAGAPAQPVGVPAETAPVAPEASRKPVALMVGFSRHAPQFNAVTSPAAPALMTPVTTAVSPAIPEVILDASAQAVSPAATESVAAVDTSIRLTPEALPPTPPVTFGAPIVLPLAADAAATTVAESPVVTPPAIISPAPEPVSAHAVGTTDPTERIAAIKREVNGLVGNPVNLIDVNNEVGREYMNALLDAMKKTLGATPAQETERAMARLERAFVAVKETLDQSASTAVATQPPIAAVTATANTPPSTGETAPVVPPVPVTTPEVQPTAAVPELTELVVEPPALQSMVPSPEPVQRRILSVASLDEAVAPEVTPFKAVAPAPHVPEPVSPSSSDTQSDAAPLRMMSVGQMMPVQQPVVPNTERVVAAVIDTEPHAEVITSVAKEKQLKELMEARQAAEAASRDAAAVAAANNPLMADAVTSGLGQLLSEWKLFKSSGIFGTGPSGTEHPLYKKISQLTMAAILAGRFEGATPDIKRSIADYMNGWRYEEGIVHEQGETFEMYLRRVIRHILDNQPT